MTHQLSRHHLQKRDLVLGLLAQALDIIYTGDREEWEQRGRFRVAALLDAARAVIGEAAQAPAPAQRAARIVGPLPAGWEWQSLN